jgi:hypothetical protein
VLIGAAKGSGRGVRCYFWRTTEFLGVMSGSHEKSTSSASTIGKHDRGGDLLRRAIRKRHETKVSGDPRQVWSDISSTQRHRAPSNGTPPGVDLDHATKGRPVAFENRHTIGRLMVKPDGGESR